jgi:uncharacterized protein (TIGR03086 family)
MIDMTSPCRSTAKILDGVTDDQLAGPTPCEQLTLSEVVAHVGGLGVAFAAAARKDLGELTDSPPGDEGYVLDDEWRAQYPANLAALADAWTRTDAWDGMTRVGGVDLPGEVCGMVGLAEVVIHGWDVAVATGQDYAVDDDVAEAVLAHIDPGACAFDRALALSGRDPEWQLSRRD